MSNRAMVNEPKASRPYVPGYGVPESEEGMLPWSYVCDRMKKSRNYWIATATLKGQPHVTPVWGVWIRDALYFDGSPQTRRGRQMAANPRIAVHLEDGDKVVILEGEVCHVGKPEPELAIELSEAYSAKYAPRYMPSPDTWDSGGLYMVRPHVAFAWTSYPQDATRWYFRNP
jgi:nitroimidazol reductase NimA-like FMN-containing flavoprotein (pyridoxamine 5'-phosphate oxidase superfamily)